MSNSLGEETEADSYNSIVKGHIREAVRKALAESAWTWRYADLVADDVASAVMPIVENVISDLY